MSENDNPSTTDDSSTKTEHPATIYASAENEPPFDATGSAFEDAVATAPRGEPFGAKIPFRAIVLRRVDLERERGESFGDWIRGAVDQRLTIVTDGETDPFEGVDRGRPSDYTPTHDTPDEEVIEAVEMADADEWVGVTVEFPASVLDAVSEERDGDETIADWIRVAVPCRFSMIEGDIELKPPVQIHVPDVIARRARLKAEHLVIAKPDASYQDQLRAALLELVQAQDEFIVGGEVIASFADEEVSDPARIDD